MINLRKILIYSAVSIPLVILFITLAAIFNRTGSIETRIITENRVNSEQIEIIKQNIMQISSDLNQTRSLVGLPESEYSLEVKTSEIDDNNPEPEQNNTVYYKGFEYLKNHFNELELLKKLSELSDNIDFKAVLENNSLLLMEKDKSIIIADNRSELVLFTVTADNSENAFVISSPFDIIEKAVFASSESEKITEYISLNTSEAKKIEQNLLKNIENVRNLTTDNEVRDYLKRNRLYFDNYISGEDKTTIQIKRESGVKIADVALDHSDNSFVFCSNNYTDFISLRNDLLNINSICDIRTFDEKRIDESKSDIKRLSDDESFIKYLSDNGFVLSTEMREDSDYYYYDILAVSSKTLIGSFAVHKVNGEIYLTDHEEIPLSSLTRFNSMSKKKN